MVGTQSFARPATVARLQHRSQKPRSPPRSPVHTAALPTPAPRRRGYRCAIELWTREMQVIEPGKPDGRWNLRRTAIAFMIAAGVNAGIGSSSQGRRYRRARAGAWSIAQKPGMDLKYSSPWPWVIALAISMSMWAGIGWAVWALVR